MIINYRAELIFNLLIDILALICISLLFVIHTSNQIQSVKMTCSPRALRIITVPLIFNLEELSKVIEEIEEEERGKCFFYFLYVRVKCK